MNDDLDLTSTFWRSEKVLHRIAAMALLVVLTGLASLTVAMYNQSFTETADVTVHASRAGLQMRKGTIVKLRGVDVGRTGSTTLNPDGSVDVQIKLRPDMVDAIPADVTASLEQLTAFGNKHVALISPVTNAAAGSDRHLRPGDVIQASHVSVEVNDVFDHLAEVLTALPPARVNTTLSAIATALRGQGANMGKTIDVLNEYLGKLSRDLPTLRRDFDKGSRVLDTYAEATPDLMGVLSNASVTADTISARRTELREFLKSLQQVSKTGSQFLDDNGAALSDLLNTSVPTTELLARYSPMYTCFLRQMDRVNRRQEDAFGSRVPGVTATISVIGAGNDAYQNPKNLPVMGADIGPRCHGGPDYDGSYIPRSMMVPFDLGGEPNPPGPGEDSVSLSSAPLAVQLFGPLALGGLK